MKVDICYMKETPNSVPAIMYARAAAGGEIAGESHLCAAPTHTPFFQQAKGS